MIIDRKTVPTNKGVMQGGVTSPITFALYIDDMLRQLNQTSDAYALADDIVCFCDGEMRLYQTTQALKFICNELDLKINFKKSGILILKIRRNKK